MLSSNYHNSESNLAYAKNMSENYRTGLDRVLAQHERDAKREQLYLLQLS